MKGDLEMIFWSELELVLKYLVVVPLGWLYWRYHDENCGYYLRFLQADMRIKRGSADRDVHDAE